MAVVPPMVQRLAIFPTVDEYDLSSLKSIAYTAAPMAKDVLLQFTERFKVPNAQQGSLHITFKGISTYIHFG